MSVKRLFAGTAALAFLVACSEPDLILPGERLDYRDGMAGAAEAQVNSERKIALPKARANADWETIGGVATHNLGQVALGAAPQLAFAVDLGEGESRRARITASPVVSGGVVVAMDARARVTAMTTTGDVLWAKTVGPRNSDDLNSASGGLLAASGGRVYVATPYGALVALDRNTGAEIWTQDLGAPASAAPTVDGNLLYVVGGDGRGWAIEAETGRVRWNVIGTPPSLNSASGSAVAIADGLAIFPMPSGDLIAAFKSGGLQRWSSVIAGARLGNAAASRISDIPGGPVVNGDTLYVGNVSGRVAALALATGERLWTAREGAESALWYAGGSLFFVNDLNQLVRMDAANGEVIWRQALPGFIEPRFGLPNTRHASYGPVLAGGRLIVASSDGALRQFDPVSGALVGQVELPGGAASEPIVAGGVLYVVSKTGQLLAFR